MQRLIKKISHLKSDAYIRNSATNFTGSLLVNILSYIFNIIIGRALGPAQYSEYLSLITLWYVATIPSGVLQTVVIRNIAHFHNKGDVDGVYNLLHIFSRYGLIWGVIVGAALLLLSTFLSSVLNIDSLVNFLIIIALISVSYLSSVWLAYFIGMERYVVFSLLSGSGILLRIVLVIGILLVDKSVTTVLLAMLSGIGVQIFLTLAAIYRDKHRVFKIPLSKIFAKFLRIARRISVEKTIKKEITTTLKTSLVSVLGLALLTQSDIILARIRLSAQDAGLYASLAVTGKIIPFFTLPLVGVLLPHITGNIAKNQPCKNTLLLASCLVGLGSGSVAIFYALFPEFVIKSFLGNDYIKSAPYLGAFALFQTLYSLTSVGVYASIAMNKVAQASAVMFVALIQVALILLMQPTIENIIWANLISLSIALLYYAYTLFIMINQKAHG